MSEMLTAKLLRVLLACISDFVPDGLRAHPDVVDDPERVTSLGKGTCWHEHSCWVVLAGHRRAADPAEPGLPI